MSRSLLITGGAGFIGSNFVRFWAARHPEDRIVVLDLLTYAGRRSNLADLEAQSRTAFVHGDICDGELVSELLWRHGIDTVVNFAAESHVDRSIVAPDAFVQTNIVGTHVLLEMCRNAWGSTGYASRRYHQISTDEVYGSLEPTDSPARETHPCLPNSPYAASKAAADHLVRAYGRTYGLSVTISRSPNNYGPFQYPEKLIPVVLRSALLGQRIPLYGDGLQVRDWVYVRDHCEGIAAVLERGAEGEVYNVGAETERRNVDLANALCEMVDASFARDATLARRFPDAPAAKGRPSAVLIETVADRPGHDSRCAIDASKVRDALGFRPAHEFEAALRSTVAWYIANADWWQTP